MESEQTAPIGALRVKACKLTVESQLSPVLDLGLISIASLGPRASTKVESHEMFSESLNVSQPKFFFCNVKHKEV